MGDTGKDLELKEQIDVYLGEDWPIGFIYDKDGGYFVKVIGVKGCMSQGETLEEACWMIVDAFRLWLEVALEDGDKIPMSQRTSTAAFWDDYTVIMLLRFVHRLAAVHEGRKDD